jgi:hypothetical protein
LAIVIRKEDLVASALARPTVAFEDSHSGGRVWAGPGALALQISIFMMERQNQALNNSREQFKNAGDVVSIGHQMLVEAKEEITRKNDRQNAAVDVALTRLFGNQEGLGRLMDAMADYIYDYHHRPQA